MKPNLIRKTFSGIAITMTLMALLLFLPAGTVNYWQGWGFLSVYLLSTLVLVLYLFKYDQALLERRMQMSEKTYVQRLIMFFIITFFIAILIVAGLDHRLGWSDLAPSYSLIGDAMIALGFVIYFLVFRENSYAASTIQKCEGQRVIDTGPYGIVRHPMYFGGIIFLAGMPLALASLWAFVPLICAIPFLLWRLFDEEKFLTANLEGYKNYCQQVRYRLLPGVF